MWQAAAVDLAVAILASVVAIELRDLAHDSVNALLTGFPGPALAEAIAQVTGADAVIAVTPLFNGSYSGLFKSFFDVLDPDALRGKPVLIAATGGTARHSLALEHAIRPLFSYLRTVTVPTALLSKLTTGDTGVLSLTRQSVNMATGANVSVQLLSSSTSTGLVKFQ